MGFHVAGVDIVQIVVVEVFLDFWDVDGGHELGEMGALAEDGTVCGVD